MTSNFIREEGSSESFVKTCFRSLALRDDVRMPNAQWFLPEVGALGGEEALPGSCCAMHITLRFLTAFGELYASLCFGVREGKKESPLFERRHCGRSDWASLVI